MKLVYLESKGASNSWIKKQQALYLIDTRIKARAEALTVRMGLKQRGGRAWEVVIHLTSGKVGAFPTKYSLASP